jgi:hypothetical protein
MNIAWIVCECGKRRMLKFPLPLPIGYECEVCGNKENFRIKAKGCTSFTIIPPKWRNYAS